MKLVSANSSIHQKEERLPKFWLRPQAALGPLCLCGESPPFQAHSHPIHGQSCDVSITFLIQQEPVPEPEIVKLLGDDNVFSAIFFEQVKFALPEPRHGFATVSDFLAA